MRQFNSDEKNMFDSWVKRCSVYCSFCKTKHELPSSSQILFVDTNSQDYYDSMVFVSCTNQKCPVGIFQLTSYSILKFFKGDKSKLNNDS